MEYTLDGNVLHGRSFAFPLDGVDFVTWKYNPETKLYWLKFHFTSKEVRIRVSLEELNHILGSWFGIEFDINQYKNGDEYELVNNR